MFLDIVQNCVVGFLPDPILTSTSNLKKTLPFKTETHLFYDPNVNVTYFYGESHSEIVAFLLLDRGSNWYSVDELFKNTLDISQSLFGG